MNRRDVFIGPERGQKGVMTVEYAVMLVLAGFPPGFRYGIAQSVIGAFSR